MEQYNSFMVSEWPNGERIMERKLALSCDEASNRRGREMDKGFGRKYPKNINNTIWKIGGQTGR
jgi:hypothetical protein